MSQSVYSIAKYLEANDQIALWEQIEERISALIETGVLRAGDRLPPTRELAVRFGVNRGVVLKALRALDAAGKLKTRAGSGVTVAVSPLSAPVSPREIRFSSALSRLSAELPGSEEDEIFADLSRLAPDPVHFPVEDFARVLAETFRSERRLLQYASPFGLPALRLQIARRMQEVGAPWKAEEILVTSGAQQGLDLIFKAFVDPGDAVAVESPTYPGILPLLRFYGAQTVELPVSQTEGHDLSPLSGRRARLIYTMPERHNPTGVTMDAPGRRMLVAEAISTGGVILEDGYETPASDNPPLCALNKSRVITLGSFSKELAPGFRVGWIAADLPLLRAIGRIKQTADFQTPLPLQAAIAEFLRAGGDREVRRRRSAEIAERRKVLLAAVARHWPEGRSAGADSGGSLFWLELPAGISGREIARRAAERGVRVAAGAEFDPSGRDLSALRLSISRVDSLLIDEAVARLAQAIRETVEKNGMAAAIPMV